MLYERIKETAKELGVSYRELIALAPQNDPFYVGTPSDLTYGHWFADIWRRAGFRNGVHLRRVHYWIVSQRIPVPLPRPVTWKSGGRRQSTDVYINHDRCWGFLLHASKVARYLGLVRIADIADNKNPDPHINARYWGNNPDCWIDVPELTEPDINISGLDVVDALPYHLEVWCEKSTMDDVLLPVCRDYYANLVTFEGEVSITACHDLMERIEESDGKPTRIFYISDFDPAGNSMPVAMARKVEYMIARRGLDYDVAVIALALTADQVREYQLPRVPIKDTELRAGSFEEAFGEGATELDALEALHPGALGRLVRRALAEYHSDEAAEAVLQKQTALREIVQEQIDKVTRKYRVEIAAIQGMLDELAEIEIDAAGYEVETFEATVDDEEIGWWLFHSGRDYVDQIGAYKAHKGGDAGR